MELEIAVDAPLDSVTFRISPQDRYDAFVCRGDKEEKLRCGPIDDLILHLPQLKDSYLNGSYLDVRLQLPQNPATWFTKATLSRFLHLVESGDALRKSISIKSEISQLEETRLFHLSLYAKAESGIAPSDDSKNELLRAMDLRLKAVQEELAATFNRAVGSRCSLQELTDLENFCERFGIEDLRNLLCKVLELVEGGQLVDLLDNSKLAVSHDSRSDSLKETDPGESASQLSCSSRPVKYNASPAKAAEIERQSSTESGDSSDSSEDRRSAERSRPLTRSATPRRSASPMRRIQIGRSGSRRAPTITIKSLNSFPVREKALSYKNAALNDDAEVPEQPAKRTEVNVTRMSVQDAISLFESKQRDQATDVQKKSVVDNPANVQKSVLRRWSSSVGESSAQCATQDFPGQIQDATSISDNNPIDVDEGTSCRTAQLNQDINSTSGDHELADRDCESSEAGKAGKAGLELGRSGKHSPDPYESDIPVSGAEETIDRMDSAAWNRRKEAELNQMLMKFMQTPQCTNQNAETAKSKGHNPHPVQKGGRYDQYKERKDVKLRGENVVKKLEKKLGSTRTQHKIVNKTKAENSPKDVTDLGKKTSVTKTQNVVQSTPQILNRKRESPKPALSKKASPRPLPLPATRKSWPSTPSLQTTGTSPAKSSAGVTSSSSTALRQKSRSPASVSRPIPKVERSQLLQKDGKKGQVATKKSSKGADENKRQVVTNTGTVAKKKVLKASDDNAAPKSPVKPGPRSKATKKSSVVPLDSKPTARKGPRNSPANSPNKVNTKMFPSNVDEPVTSSKVSVQVQKDVAVGMVSNFIVQPAEMIPVLQENDVADFELQTEIDIHPEGGERDNSSEMPAEGDEELGERMPDPLGEIQPEEPAISPSTWVEDDKQGLPIPCDSVATQIVSPANPAAMASSGPRVRHSLSQMLLEETSEPDIIEWGNAENPPAIVYQKDAPKGLKRLLKFARKSRDVNQAGWSTSPYTSEGEDDGEESKSFGKRSSEDLRKLALHGRRYEGYDRNMTDPEPLSARSNTSNSSVQSWSKFHEGHGSTGNNKATKSFFSLSAFRGNKAASADTKLR